MESVRIEDMKDAVRLVAMSSTAISLRKHPAVGYCIKDIQVCLRVPHAADLSDKRMKSTGYHQFYEFSSLFLLLSVKKIHLSLTKYTCGFLKAESESY